MPAQIALHGAVFLAGVFVVAATLLSAVRTFVLPRSANDPVTRRVFIGMRRLFNIPLKRTRDYERRDAVMALYAPISLLALVAAWLVLVHVGYGAMYWAVGGQAWPWTAGGRDWIEAFTISGSSLFTLGFAALADLPTKILAFTEAGIGLVLIALLISYLPTIYSAFSRRESAVNALEVRAGSPPSAVTLIERIYRLGRQHHLEEFFTQWEQWFVELDETHTSLAALSFFRSPQPRRSWVTASGAVLDAAALIASAVEIKRESQEDLCIRAGYLALRHICDFFRIPYHLEPDAGLPIGVTRAEFDAACERLAAAGVPLRADRHQAWRDFAGWRCTYDEVLLAMAELTMAPEAPWSSDRCAGQIRRLHAKYAQPRRMGVERVVEPRARRG